MARKNEETQGNGTPDPADNGATPAAQKKSGRVRLTRNFKGRQIGEHFTVAEAKKLGVHEQCEEI